MPPDRMPPTVPTPTRNSSLLVRAAACSGVAILMLVFATTVYIVSGAGGRDFQPRFPPLVMIAWTTVWTLGSAALLLTRIGMLAAPLPKGLLRIGPWLLAAYFASFALLHLLSTADGRSGDWQMGPLLLFLAGLCIVVASEEPASRSA